MFAFMMYLMIYVNNKEIFDNKRKKDQANKISKFSFKKAKED